MQENIWKSAKDLLATVNTCENVKVKTVWQWYWNTLGGSENVEKMHRIFLQEQSESIKNTEEDRSLLNSNVAGKKIK